VDRKLYWRLRSTASPDGERFSWNIRTRLNPALRVLPDYATAYWGDNLARLMAVKQHYDPDNLFRHAQSVPLSVPMV
jgi:berberine-like enzyme